MSLEDTFLKIFFRSGFDLFWCLWELFLAVFSVVFIHRCTWFENPGGSSNFCQNPWGGVKIARGSPMLGFIAFLLASFSKICLGVLFHPPYASPLCIYVFIQLDDLP
jgi:hypothetical protein